MPLGQRREDEPKAAKEGETVPEKPSSDEIDGEPEPESLTGGDNVEDAEFGPSPFRVAAGVREVAVEYEEGEYEHEEGKLEAIDEDSEQMDFGNLVRTNDVIDVGAG